jgi:hypothetical protein
MSYNWLEERRNRRSGGDALTSPTTRGKDHFTPVSHVAPLHVNSDILLYRFFDSNIF